MQTNGPRVLEVKGIWLVFMLMLLTAWGGIAEGSSVVKVSRETVNITIDTRPAPDQEYIDGGTLTVAWEPAKLDPGAGETGAVVEDKKNIYYEASDLLWGDKKIPSEYIEVSTPYSGGYQPLNKPVLFLKADEEKPVQVKFRIHRDAWRNAGQFSGYLTSTSPMAKNGVIQLNVNVKEYTALTVDSGSGQGSTVIVNADRGPGTYEAEQKIFVRAITNTGGSTLMVSSKGLEFIDSEGKTGLGQSAVPVIQPSAIWIIWEDSYQSREYNLGNAVVLDCPNGITEYSFAVKVQTQLEHVAGVYKGNIHFTLAN
ncbi:MAG: hypothetical protein GX855_09295 [Firmicutes bacterium]|nr:hypothetical protein [Bacillota bacterium]